MPADATAEDRIAPAGRGRSTNRGDVPDSLQRRYYTDERGGPGTGFYVDARVQQPAFRDRGRELVANRPDPIAIRDMASIARHRGWTTVQVRGSSDFRREAWLASRSLGLEVQGYRATERDLQELQRRLALLRQPAGRREVREERRHRGRDDREVRRERRDDGYVERQLRIVDAVVRATVTDPERQDRIIAKARDRLANLLERDVQADPANGERKAAMDRQRVR